MNWLNEQVFQSAARWALGQVGAWVALNGWLTQDQAATASGAVLTLLVLAFSVISARTKQVALRELGNGSVSEGKAVVKDAKERPTIFR